MRKPRQIGTAQPNADDDRQLEVALRRKDKGDDGAYDRYGYLIGGVCVIHMPPKISPA